MKIQEMKSGILHLNKKMEDERRENLFDMPRSGDWPDDRKAESPLRLVPDSELDKPIWSVISFDRRVAGALTYDLAAELMSGLDARGVNGLCIVTDQAAERIKVRRTTKSVDQVLR